MDIVTLRQRIRIHPASRLQIPRHDTRQASVERTARYSIQVVFTVVENTNATEEAGYP